MRYGKRQNAIIHAQFKPTGRTGAFHSERSTVPSSRREKPSAYVHLADPGLVHRLKDGRFKSMETDAVCGAKNKRRNFFFITFPIFSLQNAASVLRRMA